MSNSIEVLRSGYRARLTTAAGELRTIAERIQAGSLYGGEGAGLARYCVEIDVCTEALRALGEYTPRAAVHVRPSARAPHRS